MNRRDRKVPTGSKTWRANRNGGRGCGNGLQALIRPATGEPDARRGAGSRTGRRRIRQEVKEAGRELQPRRGGLETGSRPGRAKGRIETSASSLTVARRLSGQRSVAVKSRCGEQRRRRGQVSRCRVRAGHAGWRARCEVGHLEPFLFLACPQEPLSPGLGWPAGAWFRAALGLSPCWRFLFLRRGSYLSLRLRKLTKLTRQYSQR